MEAGHPLDVWLQQLCRPAEVLKVSDVGHDQDATNISGQLFEENALKNCLAALAVVQIP